MNPNERRRDETYAAYRDRRRNEARIERERSRGRMLWHSETQGTYIREKHGPL